MALRRISLRCLLAVLSACLLSTHAGARPALDYILIEPRAGSIAALEEPEALFGLSLDDEDEDLVVESVLPVRDPLVGRLDLMRPAGLSRERCRFYTRNLLRIGHGASPDGRPSVCRLSSFLRRIRMREAGRMRTGLRPLRFRLNGVPVPVVVERRSSGFFVPSGPMMGGGSGVPYYLYARYPSVPSPPRFAYSAPLRPSAPLPDPVHTPASIRAFDARRIKTVDAR